MHRDESGGVWRVDLNTGKVEIVAGPLASSCGLARRTTIFW
jgi:hypothetical protein